MLTILKKLFSRTPKKAVIIEYFKSSTHSDIAVHAANNTGIIVILDGENLEERMRRWVKNNNCRIVHSYRTVYN